MAATSRNGLSINCRWAACACPWRNSIGVRAATMEAIMNATIPTMLAAMTVVFTAMNGVNPKAS